MRPLLIPSVFFWLASATTFAQDAIPDAVARHISDETFAVVQIELKSLESGPAGTLFADWIDPVHPVSSRAKSLDRVLQALRPLPVSNVYFILGTSDLPLDGLLVVPTTDGKAVVEALKSVWPEDVEELKGRVVAGSAAARQRLRSSTPAARAEFGVAMQSLQGLTIRVAIAASHDARRVLREFLPVLPAELGGGLTVNVVDKTQWIGCGFSMTPKAEVRLFAQNSDANSAQELHHAIVTALDVILKTDSARQLLSKTDELRVMLTPSQDNDRLTLILNDANGGAKRLTEDVIPPLLEQARRNARQGRTVANLKHLGLAMHNYLDAHKSFPPAASRSKNGQQLLSWRVLILPYLDEKALFDQFHLDEPWDSEHNRRLIEKMPAIFSSSNISPEQHRQGMTTYLVPIGEKTVFEKPEGVRIRDITDGTSNTIMIVDALQDRAVIWTRPEDLPFDPKDPFRGVAVPPKGKFWTAFCDGSARRLGESTPANNRRRYFQMNDGEILDPE